MRSAVARRRATDENPDDAFRGLYISDEHIDRLLADAQHDAEPAGGELLARIETAADEAAAEGTRAPPARLAEAVRARARRRRSCCSWR